MKKYDYVSNNEKLMQEWNWEKNNALNLFPDKISCGSKQKVWWKCTLNHEWKASINHRAIRFQGCPYCANKKILVGYNDLATTHPQLLKEWNYELNKDILPTAITFGSRKMVWWQCTKLHNYKMAVVNKLKSGCPYCANKKILVGYNDLATTHSYLCEEWDYKKNNGLKPTDITYGYESKVWWKCKDFSHSWSASPNNRTNQKSNCPYCGNKKVLVGFNDLETLYPNIAKMWHPILNKIKPSNVLPGSNKKAWWICEKDRRHIFCTKISSMSLNKNICPICSNKKIIVGVNDLATTHPEIVKEWDYNKNTNIQPTGITYGNNTKVWWKCASNHSWQATISSRAGSQKTGCPICKKELFISFPEKTISYYLSKCFRIEENKQFDWLGNSELDIYISDYRVAIEYDGQAWHKNTY